ncbi:MAG: PAS domain-containing protein [Gemmatimonadota bacterium]|nr:PAS domain-containing protein [Gemmatimonadota bacterium]
MRPDSETIFPGSGEMARRGREMDWAATSLGPMNAWPAALRVAARTMIECPFPISLWCAEDLTLIYNDAYRQLLGEKHPASLGKPGSVVWSEIWVEIEPLFTTIRDGGPAAYEQNAHFVMNRKGAQADEAWFNFSLSPIREEDGRIIAIMNAAAETTDHVRADETVRQAKAAAELAERQLREVFAQAPAFLAVLRGKDHVFEFVNDAYMQLVGRRDLVGRTVVDALPEMRSQGFVELLDRVFNTGKPYTGRDIPVTLAASPNEPPEQRFLDFVYQPITDASGVTGGIVAHGSDVTEAVRSRREMERLWRESEMARTGAEESEERYRFLANAIPVQVWTATPEGTLDYVSERTATYFGKSPQEVIGDQWLSVLHPDDLQRTMDTWLRCLGTGEPYQIEFRLKSADNTYRWHLGRATAQRDEAGTVIRWFGSNTDIEDGKRAEAELQRLTNDAMEASRAKSDFLAAMSHELRTPLNAIGGYAQLIEMGVRGPITEEQRADLLRIQRSKNHLDSLVSDVLNFAKAGRGESTSASATWTCRRCSTRCWKWSLRR